MKATAVVHRVQDEPSVQDAFAACKHSLDLATTHALKGDVELTQVRYSVTWLSFRLCVQECPLKMCVLCDGVVNGALELELNRLRFEG